MTDHEPDPRPHHGPTTTPLREVVLLFLTIGFGGPAAHIALMHEEVVRRRGWLDEQQFVDLVGATNLIPGPNSTELPSTSATGGPDGEAWSPPGCASSCPRS